MQNIRILQKINATIMRFGNNYEIFKADFDFRNSISMSLMQIGEIVGGLSDEFKVQTSEKMQWGGIKAMRNYFAHGYDLMDKDIIWEVATKDIPALLKFCDEIIFTNRD
jgi:uncharacterized protein with HEPN domain